MRIWLAGRWEDLRTSFWFLPSIMVAGAVVFSLATISLDKATADHNWIAMLGWTFSRGPEGSRAVLSVVAGSMMTITSVTFSITIVALQLASSQFGPRLLRNFMGDRGNQVAIGTFIATYTYCLLVLRTVNGTDDQEFVPHISVTVGLFLSLASLGVLIYFIHHAAASIQAENVIASVNYELQKAIHRLYPENLGEEPPIEPDPLVLPKLPDDFDRDSRPISDSRSDYLQAIDVDNVLELAKKHDLVISIRIQPGKFYFAGNDLARVWPKNRVDDEMVESIRGVFYLGSRRSLSQDIEYAIDQLVEIAVRALSPGVNDPFTAMTCIDRLGASLCLLTSRVIPSPNRLDDEGRLRVLTTTSSIDGILDAMFNQIRQAARGDVSVTMRLLETFAAVARQTRDPAFQASLRRHAELVHRGSREGVLDPSDREDVSARYRQVMDILDGIADLPPTPGPRA
ncbi:DUF2254 domain-containing protein [Tundrisphaera lichenicola]|uniref:DUF2254 domain-containing protein n=1 Tax=Tundrisphaera lichenicola TaxID=2029860 RepID=UPI003EBD7379